MLYSLCVPDMYLRITPTQDMGRLPQIVIQVLQFWLGNALPDRPRLKKLPDRLRLKKLPNRLRLKKLLDRPQLKKLPNKLPCLTHNLYHMTHLLRTGCICLTWVQIIKVGPGRDD